ncbi:hypothetical protein JOB34_03770 [Allobranchiibius sp. GilTou38]|nr:hypothetical protein [Allobranchiibius sp. GilTou38]
MDQPPNSARRVFLHPEARSRYANWEAIASETASQLRLMGGRRPDDARIAELVQTLATHSEPFRRLWDTGDVAEERTGSAVSAHQLGGRLRVDGS